MFGLGSIASYIGQFLGGPLTAITGQVANYFTSEKNVEATEFASMNSTERDEYIAAVKAQTDLNDAKVRNNTSWSGSHFMIFAYGLPPAIYNAAVFMDSFFGGGHITAAPKRFEDFGFKIGLSFFILAPTLTFGAPIARALSTRLRGK